MKSLLLAGTLGLASTLLPYKPILDLQKGVHLSIESSLAEAFTDKELDNMWVRAMKGKYVFKDEKLWEQAYMVIYNGDTESLDIDRNIFISNGWLISSDKSAEDVQREKWEEFKHYIEEKRKPNPYADPIKERDEELRRDKLVYDSGRTRVDATITWRDIQTYSDEKGASIFYPAYRYTVYAHDDTGFKFHARVKINEANYEILEGKYIHGQPLRVTFDCAEWRSYDGIAFGIADEMMGLPELAECDVSLPKPKKEKKKPKNETPKEKPVYYNPSFSCEKATTFTEKTICSDKELSDADRELGIVYKRLIKPKPGSRIDIEGLKQRQKEWIIERDRRYSDSKSCYDSAKESVKQYCALSIIRSRIDSLLYTEKLFGGQ